MKSWKRYSLLLVFVLVALSGCLDVSEPEWAVDHSASSNEGITAVKDGQVCSDAQLSPPADSLRLHFIDVGQGDAVWVQTPDGQNILIDAGDLEYTDNDGGKYVLSYLSRWGFAKGSTFDAVIVTHAHSDHYGGLLKVLDHYNTAAYADPGCDTLGAKTYFSFISDMESALSPQRFYRPVIGTLVNAQGGETDLFGEQVRAWVLFADHLGRLGEGEGNKLNNTSIVLRLAYANRSVLLMADAEVDAEYEIINRYANNTDEPKLSANILKVGHHGSDTSSGSRFIDAVYRNTPEGERYAIIQSGRKKFSGATLPRPEIVNRLFDHVDELKLFSTEAGDRDKSTTGAPGDDDVLAVIHADGKIDVCYSRPDLQ